MFYSVMVCVVVCLLEYFGVGVAYVNGRAVNELTTKTMKTHKTFTNE
jgi:hypothetical protein